MSAPGAPRRDVAPALATIAAAATDPFLAQQVRHMQQRAAEALADLMHHAHGMLAIPPVVSQAPASVNLSALAGAARFRQSQGIQQRELAEALVLGVVINAGNPDWDPMDPASSRASDDNLLLALLQAELPDAQP